MFVLVERKRRHEINMFPNLLVKHNNFYGIVEWLEDTLRSEWKQLSALSQSRMATATVLRMLAE